MKTKTIISAIIISAAIWLSVNWFMRFMDLGDYGFTAAMLIVVVWYVTVEIIRIINNEKEY